MKAKKGYGQNFLKDKSVSQNIASDALLEAGDTVLEIGPGQILPGRPIGPIMQFTCFQLESNWKINYPEQYGVADNTLQAPYLWTRSFEMGLFGEQSEFAMLRHRGSIPMDGGKAILMGDFTRICRRGWLQLSCETPDNGRS